MRCLGARTCPSPRPKPHPIRLREPAYAVNKTHGLCNIHGPGERGHLPCQAAWRTMSPWGPPVSVPSDFFPPSQGTWGALSVAPPLLSSLLHAAKFLCCQTGSHSPSSALGGCRAKVFAAPCLGSPRPLPQSGNSGHQVPCIEKPLCRSAFPRSRLTWGEPVSPLPALPPGMMVPTSFCMGGRGSKSITTCRRAGDPP